MNIRIVDISTNKFMLVRAVGASIRGLNTYSIHCRNMVEEQLYYIPSNKRIITMVSDGGRLPAFVFLLKSDSVCYMIGVESGELSFVRDHLPPLVEQSIPLLQAFRMLML